LVRLALEPGVTVRSDRLMEELWAEDAASARPNTLQSKVAKLRRALGDPKMIVSANGGYRLDVPPQQVDVSAALYGADTARRLLDAGEERHAIELCASVLDLFTGELLAGAGHAPWVAPHHARLEATRVQLMEIWSTARLRMGESSAVIADLEMYVAEHPFHERLWSLLITALYQAGRQADALDAYQRARTTLAEELGLDPGPELRDLERQILHQDDRLVPAAATVGAGGRAVAGNLPSLTVQLIGRDLETGAVADLVREHRLVEIVGPGGVGKTALALAVGRRLTYPGGVWFVRLEGARTATEVADATIAALGVTGGEAGLIERLKVASTLLVVDNCEHVLAEAGGWVVRLLDATDDVHVLCTSQAPLEVPGSSEFVLAPLDVEDAVALFTARSAGHRPRRSVSASTDDLRALCRALDGLPLAIELAAARTRTLSVEEITERLDDRFVVLNDPTSHRPERRRALRSTIAWSYDLLFPDDQRGLWALAAFGGGAALPAVEFVLAALGVPATVTIDVLSRLEARSLLVVDHHDTGTRYRLLDSIRAFALDATRDAGLSDVARDAHARWFADASLASTSGVRSSRQHEHLGFVRDERANIDQAIAWLLAHDPHRALVAATGYGWAWVVLGDSRGAQRIRTATEAVGDAAEPVLRAEALLLMGWIEASTGDLGPAQRHVEDAARLAEAIGDVELQARAAYYLAYVVSHHGDFREGLALTDRSRELYAGLDRPWDLAANGLFATRAAISAGDEARSVRAADDVEHWLSVVDDPWLRVRGDAMLGELARLQHRFDDAVRHIARAADTSRRLGFRQTEAYQVASLGRAQCQAGDYESGTATLILSIEKAEATGDVRMAALARVHLGRVLRALGRVDEARTVLGQTVEWHREAGGGEQALLGECVLTALESADGVPGSPHRLEEILRAARRAADAPVEVFALDALARCAAGSGDTTAAAALLDEADARMQAASHFISERDRVDAAVIREECRRASA
jgi:predicted ATPase/DNA-binding SARP family transcriptional activator